MKKLDQRKKKITAKPIEENWLVWRQCYIICKQDSEEVCKNLISETDRECD